MKRLIAAVHESVCGHETDMPKYLGDVRCWVNSGKHMLASSFSGFDPGPNSDMGPPRQRLTRIARIDGDQSGGAGTILQTCDVRQCADHTSSYNIRPPLLKKSSWGKPISMIWSCGGRGQDGKGEDTNKPRAEG